MEKTGIIKHVGIVSDFTTDNGLLYSIPLTFDNLDEGLAFKKSADAYSVGQEIRYTIERKTSRQGKEYNKIKEVTENPFQGGGAKGGGKSFSDPRTMLVAYSKDIIVAGMTNGSFPVDADPFQAVIDGADQLIAWYEGKTSSNTLTDSLSAERRPLEPDMVSRPIVQGSPPEIEEQRYTGQPSAMHYAPQQPQNAQNPVVANSLGDMITGKQLGFIRKIERENGLDAEALCFQQFGCTIDELSKRSASDFIDSINPTR